MGEAAVADLMNMMNPRNLTTSTECCIFRVPNILKRHNPAAYTPNAFSIGPFHYGKAHLQDTQKIKLKYLHGLINRFSGKNPETILRDLTRFVTQVVGRAQQCYAEPIGMNTGEFVKVLVLDGCFLIEFFRKNCDVNLRESGDPVFSMSCMLEFLFHDLVLLENQIPWLVLHDLFNKTTEVHGLQCSLVELVCRFFKTSYGTQSAVKDGCFEGPDHQFKHILDLLRNSMVNTANREDRSCWSGTKFPSASRLKEAGIKFKLESQASQSILDIKFTNGILEIPSFSITEITEPLFRNLISFEQCLPNCSGEITSYAILLDNIINTTEDVEILCKNGVILNWLNTEDATKLFNQLYDDTFVKQFHYQILASEVKDYCKRRWPRYRTVLMHDYFKHPWAFVSVIAATILLILTFLQTLFTIIHA